MILPIGNVLTPAEVDEACAKLAAIRFEDGRSTAGWNAKLVKNNRQAAPRTRSEALRHMLAERILANEVFAAAVRPKALTPLLFGLKKSLEGNTRTYTSFTARELRQVFARCGFGDARLVKQFLMPMVVHRVGKGAAPLRAMEGIFRALGLTALLGSPVILRVDRR